jgi:hypothetical protein
MDSEIETTLLQAALAGDSNAFSQLFEPYRRPLLLYGYRLTPEGNYEAQSVSLLTVSGQQIKELTCFLDPRLFQRFGFPGQLAD